MLKVNFATCPPAVECTVNRLPQYSLILASFTDLIIGPFYPHEPPHDIGLDGPLGYIFSISKDYINMFAYNEKTTSP